MKKLLITLGLLLPSIVFSAGLTVPQGGTGTTTIPTNWFVVGNTSLRIKAIPPNWSFLTNYATSNLTPTSTMPIWAQGGLNASSTSHFVYASSTALQSTGSAYFATLGGNVGIGTTTSPGIFTINVGSNLTLPGAIMYEDGANASDGNLVEAYPSILTLRIKNDATYFNLNYIRDDAGSVANYVASGGSLAFDHEDTLKNWTATNILRNDGGFTFYNNSYGGASFKLGMYDYGTGIIGIGNANQAVALSNTPNIIIDTTTGLNTINQASSTLFSANQASFGGTATTTFTSNGNVGIGSSSPQTKFVVNGSIYSDVPWTGVNSTFDTIVPGVGDNNILFWDSTKGAFWAGERWTNVASTSVGSASASFGGNSVSSGYGSFSANYQTTASGARSASFGDGSISSGTGSFSIGNANTASGHYSFSGGENQCNASGYGSFCFGNLGVSSNSGSIAIGSLTKATSTGAIAIGVENEAGTGDYAIAIGGDANKSMAYAATVIGGLLNTATGQFSVIVGGENNITSGNYSYAFGKNLKATGLKSMVFGDGVSLANPLLNNQASSLYVGFNSDIPTLVVTGASGVGTLGNVGIGTTVPRTKLDIQVAAGGGDGLTIGTTNQPGDATINGVLGYLDAGATTMWVANKFDADTARFGIRMKGSAAGNEVLSVLGNGNVGIGTTTPVATLDVYGNTSNKAVAIFKQGNASNAGYIEIDSPSDSDTRPSYINILRGGNLYWATGLGYGDVNNGYNISTTDLSAGITGTKFYIKNDGNVGIGTTGPATNLYVKGTTNVATLQASNAGGNKFLNFAYTDNAADTYGNFQIQEGALVLQGGTANTRIELTPYNSGTYTAGSGLVVATSGNVGIGTTSPTTVLTVQGASVANTGQLAVVASAGNNAYVSVDSAATTANGMILKTAGNWDWFMYRPANSTDLRFLSSLGNDTVTFQRSGNVGIGTTSPAWKLEVSQPLADVGGIRITDTTWSATTRPSVDFWNTGGSPAGGASTARISAVIGPGGSDPKLYLSVADASRVLQDRMVINSTGNVGIGTTTPAEKLVVSAGNLALAGPNGLSTSQGIYKIHSAAFPESWAGMEGKTNASGQNQLDLVFYTSFGAAQEKMRILSNSGNVGIGTTGPGEKLEVNGNILIPSTGNYYVKDTAFGMRYLTATDGLDLMAWKDITFTTLSGGESKLVTIKNNGNVGIGTTTPYSKLHITAGASATTTVNFGEVGASGSHACFNTKNTVGTDISFYFVGTSMVVESNLCK